VRLAFALVAGGCASSGPERGAEQPEAPIATPTSAMLPLGDVHRTSRAVDFDGMVEDLAQADIVYVGEIHDDPEHHRLQLRILEQLYARGRLHAIGMEMFQRPFQDALDAYTIHGTLDEQGLLARTRWAERWGYDYALYRPILEFARDKRLPVLALSAPKEVVDTVREGGLEALHGQQRRALPAIDAATDPEGYAEFLRRWFPRHLAEGEAFDEERFQRFLTVMRLWDEVMADTIAAWFRDAAPPDAQILVLAGGGHVARRFGIPDRVERRIGKASRIVMPVGRHEAERDRSVFAHAYADYVWLMPEPADAAEADDSLSGSR